MITIGAIFLGLWLGGGIGIIEQALASGSWPSATGTILESKVEHTPGRHGYSPAIKYSYSVQGRAFQNSRVDFGLFWTLKSSQQIVDEYPAGNHVMVYFSPHHPDNSILLNGLRPRSFQRLIITTLIMSFLALFVTLPFLAQKYATKNPDGTYWFGAGSPATKMGWIGAGLIIGQTLLLGSLN